MINPTEITADYRIILAWIEATVWTDARDAGIFGLNTNGGSKDFLKDTWVSEYSFFTEHQHKKAIQCHTSYRLLIRYE